MTSENVEIVVGARDNSRATFDDLKKRLDELGRKVAKPGVEIEDKAALAKLDALQARLAAAGRKMGLDIKPEVVGALRAQAQLSALGAEADRLDGKRVTITERIRQSMSSLKMPSPWFLAPAAIPALAGVAAGVGAIAVSFGAAAAGAAGFGIMAKSVLASASSDSDKLTTVATSRAQKLSALQIALGAATTTAQKKQIESQIATVKKASALQTATIKAGWTKSYSDVVDSLTKVKATWENTSRAMASPVLLPWLGAVNKALGFLKPALQPVADVFKSWGQDINRYFGSHQGSSEINRLAKGFGQFSALQLSLLGNTIKNIGIAVFHLAKDVTGVNWGSFGYQLSLWSDSFAKWSKSDKARKDVQGFLRYIHDNGGTVKSILMDLAKFLPAIFSGASAAGQLELKAISTFLGFVAKLPPSWQKPIVELAGAMILLKKTGVIDVGVNLVQTGLKSAAGGAASGAAGGAAGAGAGGLLAKLGLGGTGSAAAYAAAGAAIAGGIYLRVREDLKGGLKAIGHDVPTWLSPNGGVLRIAASGWSDIIINHFSKPVRAEWVKLEHNTASTFDKIRHDGSSKFDALRHDVASKVDSLRHDAASKFDGLRHDAASKFDALRRNAASTFDTMRHAVASRADSMRHDVASRFDTMRHDVASRLDSTRRNASSAWDTIWRNTVGQARRGVGDVLSWVGKLPGRIKGFFFGAGHWLTSAGRNTIQGLWDGMSVIWHKVTSWISGLAGWIKKHKGPVSFDKQLLVPAGKALMSGLHTGLLSGFAKGPLGFISGLAGTIGGLLSQGVSGLFRGGNAGGSGVARWGGLVSRALGMLGLSQRLKGNVLYQMMTESGGNPFAVNLTDINARMGDPSKGLMQVIGTTFNAYAGPFRRLGQYNPFANIYAALNYARHRYGPSLMSGGMGIGSGHGYAGGGAAGGWAMVGEHGRELVRLPYGSNVRTNSDTERMMSGGSRVSVVLEVSTSGQHEFDRFMGNWIQKFVRVKGGGNVQAAFGQPS